MKRSAGTWLLYGGLFCVGLGLLWALIAFIDLRDGSTWHKRSRHSEGPLFYRVEASQNPSAFKAIVIRGVMPVVLIGTLAMTLLLGSAAQRPPVAE